MRAWGCALFTLCGLCAEILFTGTKAGFGGSFLGEVSLLMVPVYSFVYLIVGPLLAFLERRGWTRWPVRIPLTVLGIYGIEWSAGAAYAAVGLQPWHYEHGWASAWSGGYVTLYYLPVWIALAFVVVPAWRTVHATSPALAEAARRAFRTPAAPAPPGSGSATPR